MNCLKWLPRVILGFVLSLVSLKALAEPYGAGAEDWKGPLSIKEWSIAALPGLGVINSTGGFTLQGVLAKRILEHGFAPDINNQVFIEVQAGPFFSGPGSAFLFSTHLRWDFTLNTDWSFYAIGGLGGNVASDSFGNQWQLLPRFGVGSVLNIERQTGLPLGIRAELSRELIGVGVQFGF
jgi:hypothetical protein